MLAWMGYAMLASAALGVAAWLIDFAFVGRFRHRRVLWATVIVASAVGPVVFAAARTSAVAATGNVGAVPAAIAKTGPIVSDRVLGSAWLAVSALLGLWLVGTQRRLQRQLRDCPSRVIDGEQVLVSPSFGPAVVGVMRPRIVLPEWTLAMCESDRRIIVAHESEHRQARDPLLATVALIMVVAFPWNAALWWQLRRLRLAIEIDCDQRVVARHSHDPGAYGLLLLATRERTHRVTPQLAIAMAPMRSGLGRRIEALVGGRPQSAARRVSAVAAAAVLATGFVSVPAPRLSIGRVAAIDAAIGAPPAMSTTPAPSPPRVRIVRTRTGSTRAILVPVRDSLGSPAR